MDVTISHLPFIEELYIAFPRHSNICASFDISDSPNIRSVTLKGNARVLLSDCSPATLTYVELGSWSRAMGYPSLYEFVKLLQNSPALAEFSLRCSDLTIPPGDHPYIRLEQLKKFTVSFEMIQSEAPDFLLSRLTLPAVTQVYVDFIRPSPNPNQHTVLSLIQRSLPPLANLTINTTCMDEDDLVPCLYLLPSLLELRISFDISMDRLLRALLRRGNERDICPNPTRITFNYCRGGEDDDIILDMQEMIHSRWFGDGIDDTMPRNGKLEAVLLLDSGFRGIEDKIPVRACIRDGLQLVVENDDDEYTNADSD